MKRFYLLLIAVSLILPAKAFSALDWKNVKSFGSVGDGKNDDTNAIVRAITAAGPGGTVYFPYGEYRITGALKLNQVALVGSVDGGWPGDAPFLPKIIVAHKDAPAVEAGNSSSVRGLYFECQNNPSNPEPRPPTILLTGIGVTVSNVKIQLPWIGIASDGVSNNGRCCIENVFIISALNCGVYLAHTWDTPILNKIEVWNVLDYCVENAVGFRFGHNDQIRASSLFAFKCKTGYLFDLPESDKNNCYGDFVACSTDACANGISITKADVRFSGCTFLNHFATAKLLSKAASLQLSGCRLQSNGEPHILIEDCSKLIVSGCQFHRAFSNGMPAVEIKGGSMINISGCNFDQTTGGVKACGNADFFAITGNIFSAADFPAIDDQTPKSRRKSISGNIAANSQEEKN